MLRVLRRARGQRIGAGGYSGRNAHPAPQKNNNRPRCSIFPRCTLPATQTPSPASCWRRGGETAATAALQASDSRRMPHFGAARAIGAVDQLVECGQGAVAIGFYGYHRCPLGAPISRTSTSGGSPRCAWPAITSLTDDDHGGSDGGETRDRPCGSIAGRDSWLWRRTTWHGRRSPLCPSRPAVIPGMAG